ncbi:hypothetical protein Glove_46g161 [Diversispora epigaea]|uniref:Protein kinase domain-containing protein n=1 Tax=Diversispora epigaea TaxID=1348612 RepID=A0A397JHN3_9GLOM|nr:hypothetical protein Glove_46g161 [Diversispora epigaea]
MQDVVVKQYYSIQFIIHIQAIYNDMFKYKVPFVDQLKHVDEDETKTLFVTFSPKGVLYRPQSKKQLIKALFCVLTILKENVIKYINQDKWFIIDFDNACYTTSVTSNTYLVKENHAPKIFKSYYKKSVDIWSVGYLIQTASIKLEEFDNLKIYSKKLMAKNEINRPTTEEVLQ